MTLEWKDPPPAKAGRGADSSSWKPIIDELKSAPGQWAYLGEHSSGLAGYLTKYYGVEATARSLSGLKNRADIYARWPEAA